MVIDLLVKRADELGVEIRYETGATNLIVDDGAVVGVGWKHFNDTGAVRAKSVIIAAGGFAMNPEMVAEHTPALGQKRRTKHHGVVEPYILGNPNDDGLGIRMGVSAGGVAKNLDQLFITAAAYPPEILLTGIIVNKRRPALRRGRLVPLTHVGLRAGTTGPGGVPHRRRGAHADARDAVDPVHRRLGDRRRDGSGAGDSRGQPGRHAATLQRARGAWRGSRLPQAAGIRCAQDNGPWAAFDLSLGVAMYSGFTMGGLAVPIDGEVLRDDGSVIPGLYAAGACASNIAQDGKGYASGTQLGEGSFFGRRAGAHAARS